MKSMMMVTMMNKISTGAYERMIKDAIENGEPIRVEWIHATKSKNEFNEFTVMLEKKGYKFNRDLMMFDIRRKENG